MRYQIQFYNHYIYKKIMKYVIVKDRFYIAREEVKALTRLLKEANDRQRHLLKKENQQGWWDWLCEWIGY